MADYAMGREHFVDMGEQMHRHIYEINTSWGQMLDFYTDLNNARKEKDDSYADQNHIGEEIIEPDDHNPLISDGKLYDIAFMQQKPAEENKALWEEAEENDTGNILSQLKQENDEEEKAANLIGEKIGVKRVVTIMDD